MFTKSSMLSEIRLYTIRALLSPLGNSKLINCTNAPKLISEFPNTYFNENMETYIYQQGSLGAEKLQKLRIW